VECLSPWRYGLSVKVIVFDFDGTLIDSNKLKYDAYFSLFPRDRAHEELIREVLSEMYEESRYVILSEILRRKMVNEDEIPIFVQEQAKKYNGIVLSGAKTCPEKSGAEEVLRVLARYYRLYVSSTTPEAALREIIMTRNWQGYFAETFGYPRKKSQNLKNIMQTEQVNSSELAVIGDGESDRRSAEECGCRFIMVSTGFNLREIPGILQAI
jgi:phosphoglycolate phosphatase